MFFGVTKNHVIFCWCDLGVTKWPTGPLNESVDISKTAAETSDSDDDNE